MDKWTDNEVFCLLTFYIIKITLKPKHICFIIRCAINDFTNLHPGIPIVQVSVFFLTS